MDRTRTQQPGMTKDGRNSYAFNDKATPEQKDKLDETADRFAKLHDHISDVVPDGRERSLAYTKLEEAQYWVNKGITHEGSSRGGGGSGRN